MQDRLERQVFVHDDKISRQIREKKERRERSRLGMYALSDELWQPQLHRGLSIWSGFDREFALMALRKSMTNSHPKAPARTPQLLLKKRAVASVGEIGDLETGYRMPIIN